MLLYVFVLLMVVEWTNGQSTCPVIESNMRAYHQPQQQQTRCKCGIKTDGQIYIYCARKQLVELPRFTRSSILYEELILSGNQIRRIGTNAFAGLKVKRLYLDENPIELIEQNALVELANYLEELVISVVDSGRPLLPMSSLLKSLLNLKIIKLTGLQLGEHEPYLGASVFNRTRKLEVVHLIDCGLQGVQAGAFSGLEFSLRELNLDNNQLTSTDRIFGQLERMKRLQSLVLSRNKITSLERYDVSEQAGSMGAGFELDLSFNAINQIDEFAFGAAGTHSIVGTATRLNLNNNEISQFQLGFLSQLPALKELLLDYNKISFLPDNLFINSRGLQHLSLKGNSISQIGSEFAFAGLHFNLERLNLAANKLNSIGKRVFMQTSKLKELNLERNNLGALFELAGSVDSNSLLNTFEGIEGELRTLNLESNNMQPAHLRSLMSLLNVESLRLGNNRFDGLEVSQLANTFRLFRNLSHLDMQNSSLTQMPYFAGLNRSLISLNVAFNRLCHVNAKNLHKYYSNLRNLNLNSNPLSCDVNLISLRKWVDQVSQARYPTGQPDPTLNWKCATPYGNKYLTRLSLTELQATRPDSLCSLDDDELVLKTTTTTSTTTTTTTTTTTSTTLKQTKSNLVSDTFLYSKSLLDEEEILTTSRSPIERVMSMSASSSTSSVLNSVELRQTLLGSLIGALSVLAIVSIILCLLKSTRSKLRDFSLCSGKSDTDKSTGVSTTSSSSPYELSKLTLQTMCINSSNSSAASSGSSTSSSGSGTNATNTSTCMCGVLPQAAPHMDCHMFAKMDPLRLTLLNRASVYNPHYLNHTFSNKPANNLHYLASNLPYSPTESLMDGSCTSPNSTAKPDDKSKGFFSFLTGKSNTTEKNGLLAENNCNNSNNLSLLLLNDNTYDKLHQRFNNAAANTQTLLQNMSAASTLNYNHHQLQQQQQNSLINKYIQNLNMQNMNRQILNVPTNEATPFLIISNMNDMNRLVEFNNNNNINNNMGGGQVNGVDCSTPLSNEYQQHTYHEIGDILMNLNSANMKQQQQQQHLTRSALNTHNNNNNSDSQPIASEMFI